jgi:phenylacetate-CoA ligase
MRYQSVFGQIVWPAPLSPSASSRMALMYQLEQTQWWTAEALQRAQFEQLRQLLPYAARHVPHYRRTLAAFATGSAVTPERWHEVPLLSRDDLAPGNTDVRSTQIPREHGAVHLDSTSGSTGKGVEYLATDLTAFFWKVFALRDHLWHRRDFSQKLMVIRYVKENPEQAAKGLHGPQWGSATDEVCHTGPCALYDLRANLSFLTDRLLDEQPGYLLGHPSALAGLIDHCERRGVRPQGLLQLRSIGEMVPDDLAERSQRLWGVPLADVYTCQEAGYLATQCPDHPTNLHVQSENVLLEVVDEQGRACKPGEVGRVLMTSLHNFATPLIRYELGDYARLGGPCPCGRGLPVLERVMGRYRNLVTLPDGDTRWPRLGWEDLVKVAPVEEIQLVQHTLQDVEVRLVMREPLTATHEQALTAFIQRNLGHPFKLRFSVVQTIRHAVNGKVEAFISLLPRPGPTIRIQPRG